MNNMKSWIIAIMFLLLAATATAVPPNPELYWGYVYVEGSAAPNGSILIVESANTGELFVNQTLPYASQQGSYNIMLAFDDPTTTADEGATDGEQMTWKVNGVATATPMPGADTAEPEKTNNNYTIQAILNPVISYAIENADSVYLGEELQLNITVSNTGSGSAIFKILNITKNFTSIDLPTTITASASGSGYIEVYLKPERCGEFKPRLNAEYYNLADTKIADSPKTFSFEVKGPDPALREFKISNNTPSQGDTISMSGKVKNTGDRELNGFKVKFYDGTTLIGTIHSNESLAADKEVGVSLSYELPSSGEVELSAVIILFDDECDTLNNEAKITITATEKAETKIIDLTQRKECFNGKDDDKDGLIDFPNDPGCSSINDDDEIGGNATTQTYQTGAIEKEIQIQGPTVINDTSSIIGFVSKQADYYTNGLLILIITILLTAITVKIFYDTKKQGNNFNKETSIFEEPARKEKSVNQGIVIQNPEKPALIQKSIKISSKKDIIDKLKEVYK